jgi:hypothetical protein
MRGGEILQRLGCLIGRHQWSAWSVHRTCAPGWPPIWKTRQCVLCGRHQDEGVYNPDEVTDNDRDHHDPHRLHYDPG